MRRVIVGGPRKGKSTLAATFGVPVFCGDPRSKVKDPLPGVTYLPEHVPLADSAPGADDGAAAWVAANWFTMPGPWTCEGHVMARALRRWAKGSPRDVEFSRVDPCDQIIVLDGPPRVAVNEGQARMIKAVKTVWNEISWRFKAITEVRR